MRWEVLWVVWDFEGERSASHLPVSDVAVPSYAAAAGTHTLHLTVKVGDIDNNNNCNDCGNCSDEGRERKWEKMNNNSKERIEQVIAIGTILLQV